MLVSTGHTAVSIAPRRGGLPPHQGPLLKALPTVPDAARTVPVKPALSAWSTADVQRLAHYPEPARGGLLMYSVTAATSLSSAGAQVDVRV